MDHLKETIVRNYVFLIVGFALFLSCAQPQQVTIYRDTWGVPHIYGTTDKAVAFGFGYAQAEDRIVQLMSSYRWAEGTMSEVFGEEWIENDLIARMWKNLDISREKYNELPKDVREIIESFVAGIEKYAQDHPDKIPDWAPEIKPWHLPALGRAFIWGWPLGQAISDFRRGQPPKRKTRGSNQWIVSGTRSAEGGPIALIDPHLSWATEGHWHEARLHGKKLHVSGIAVVGTPLIGLGHNRSISWAATTGGPDCGDVYEEEINPNDFLQYRYDGQWRPIEVEDVTIRVKTAEGVEEVHRKIERTHHGPIYHRDGNKAYSIALPYAEEVRLVEQMWRMNTAGNLQEFKQAMAMRQFMPQNIMYGDIDGNIYYVRTGRVPIRPAGFNWDLPVPGSTSKSEWQGIHPHEDLVQILNPECGFMQNCNISPGTMMPDSPLKADKYPEYIYNDREDRSNPRGNTAVRLLSKEQSLTLERAFQIVFDTSVDAAPGWQQLLRDAYSTHGRQFRGLSEPIKLITEWNGRVDKDSEGATLYRAWRKACDGFEGQIQFTSDGHPEDITVATQQKALKAVSVATSTLKQFFGSYRVPWGQTLLLKRGEKEWPLSGASFENGIQTLRNIWGVTDKQTQITTAAGGQSGPILVILRKPIVSYSVLPWGVSDDPESPHFADQAEIFSQCKMKPSWFEKEDLEGHIESKVVLRLD